MAILQSLLTQHVQKCHMHKILRSKIMPLIAQGALEGFSTSKQCPLGRGCVAVSMKGDHILIGDTKNPNQTPLKFDMDEWNVFVTGVKNGDFDYQ